MIIDMGQNNRGYVRLVFYIPEKGRRRKRRKIFKKGTRIYIFSAKENKTKRKKRRKIFGE